MNSKKNVQKMDTFVKLVFLSTNRIRLALLCSSPSGLNIFTIFLIAANLECFVLCDESWNFDSSCVMTNGELLNYSESD